MSASSLKFKHSIDVHITAFTSDDHTFSVNGSAFNYKIGDPREKGSFTTDSHNTSGYNREKNELYDYYIKGERNSTYNRYVSPWPNAGDIKIGGFSTKYDEIIAPLFKIQSSYGTAKTEVYFNVAQKRCATYQEAGYPAGRWRLPTLAEIAFIVSLQNSNVIESMFNNSDIGYWTSSGGIITANNNSKYTQEQSNSGKSAYVRCVYDLWYWGSDPVKPTHEFHPMPTKQ
jgi:hypothetical protein